MLKVKIELQGNLSLKKLETKRGPDIMSSRAANSPTLDIPGVEILQIGGYILLIGFCKICTPVFGLLNFFNNYDV